MSPSYVTFSIKKTKASETLKAVFGQARRPRSYSDEKLNPPKIKMGDIFHEVVLNDASPLILAKGKLGNTQQKQSPAFRMVKCDAEDKSLESGTHE